MSRNASGVFTQLAAATATAGATISSTDHNAVMADIAAALNDVNPNSHDFDTLSIGGVQIASTSFTPAFVPDSGAFSGTYVAAVGRSVRVGPLVFFEIRLRTNNFNQNTATGNVVIGALPVTASGTSKAATVGFRGTWTDKPARAVVTGSGTTITLYDSSDNVITVSDLDYTGTDKNEIFVSGCYVAA